MLSEGCFRVVSCLKLNDSFSYGIVYFKKDPYESCSKLQVSNYVYKRWYGRKELKLQGQRCGTRKGCKDQAV